MELIPKDQTPRKHSENLLENTSAKHFWHVLKRKKMTRMPNIPDSSDDFLALADKLKRKELWREVAMCYVAASHHYYKSGDIGSEINCLIKAGRFFMHVNKQNTDVGCPSNGQTDLQAAHCCLNEAIKRYEIESEFYIHIGPAVIYSSHALDPSPNDGLLITNTSAFVHYSDIDKLISYALKQDKYWDAIKILSDLIKIIKNGNKGRELPCYRNEWHRAEINRIILILFMQISHHDESRYYKILEKFTNIDREDSNTVADYPMADDELLTLESFIHACQERCHFFLTHLEPLLCKYLDTEQKNMVRILVRSIMNE